MKTDSTMYGSGSAEDEEIDRMQTLMQISFNHKSQKELMQLRKQQCHFCSM